jgi:hypothetical protein
MTRNAKLELPRAVDGPMGAPQRFWGNSVRYNGEKIEIALYLAVFVTQDCEGCVSAEHIRGSSGDTIKPIMHTNLLFRCQN